MHPALRKGPLFYRKTPPHFPLFTNTPNFISCLHPCTDLVGAGEGQDEQSDHEIGGGERHDEAIGRRATQLGVSEDRRHHQTVAYDDSSLPPPPFQLSFGSILRQTESDDTSRSELVDQSAVMTRSGFFPLLCVDNTHESQSGCCPSRKADISTRQNPTESAERPQDLLCRQTSSQPSRLSFCPKAIPLFFLCLRRPAVAAETRQVFLPKRLQIENDGFIPAK